MNDKSVSEIDHMVEIQKMTNLLLRAYRLKIISEQSMFEVMDCEAFLERYAEHFYELYQQNEKAMGKS